MKMYAVSKKDDALMSKDVNLSEAIIQIVALLKHGFIPTIEKLYNKDTGKSKHFIVWK